MRAKIAETFVSIQGEGSWTGTPMFFIRFAGCNVGKYPKKNDALFPQLLEEPHSICTTIDGQQFVCDTNYRAAEEIECQTLVDHILEKHESIGIRNVCLTGGEPMLHWLAIDELIRRTRDRADIRFHLETSGTVDMKNAFFAPRYVNVTCSPKEGFIQHNSLFVHDWKLLVGAYFDVVRAAGFFIGLPLPLRGANVYLQPIDASAGLNQVDVDDLRSLVRIANTLQVRLPELLTVRIGLQLHKLLGMR